MGRILGVSCTTENFPELTKRRTMGLRQLLTDLFTHKTEIANYEFRGMSSSLCLPRPHAYKQLYEKFRF
jgi:hypothetical protein